MGCNTSRNVVVKNGSAVSVPQGAKSETEDLQIGKPPPTAKVNPRTKTPDEPNGVADDKTTKNSAEKMNKIAEMETAGNEEVDIDLNDPEVAMAATKIQGAFRGMKQKKAAALTPPKTEPNGEVIDIDLNDPEVERAASKIQGAFRKHKKSPKVETESPPEQKEEEIDIDLNDPEVEMAATKIQGAFRKHHKRVLVTKSADEGESIDIDLKDPEVANAATKIQASFRGHMARKNLSETNSDAAQEVIDIDLKDPEVAEAAAKIQKSFRLHQKKVNEKPIESLNQSETQAVENIQNSLQSQTLNPCTHKNCPENSNKTPCVNGENGEECDIDIDLDDPEVAKAAKKIQASFRGFQAKKVHAEKES